MEINEIKKIISTNQIEAALDKLSNLIENEFPMYSNELIVISRRFYEVNKKIISDIITYAEASQTLSKITIDILAILDKIERSSSYYNNITFPINNSNGIVEILIDDEIGNYTLENINTIVNIISALLKVEKNSIIIKKVVKGSVKVYLELDADKRLELVEIFKNPNLDRRIILLEDYNVKNIRAVNYSLPLIQELLKSLKSDFENIKTSLNKSEDSKEIINSAEEIPPQEEAGDDENDDWFDKLIN